MTEPHKIKLISADIKEIERMVIAYISGNKTGCIKYEINFCDGGITNRVIRNEEAKNN